MSTSPPTASPPLADVSLVRRWRLSQWWYFALLPAAGVDTFAIAMAPDGLSPTTLGRLLLASGAAAAALALGYYANAIGDRTMDTSAAKNPLLGRTLPAHWRLELAALGTTAVCLATLAGGPAAGGLALASCLAGLSYSLGPRLKRVVGVGSLWNLAYFLPLLGLAVDLDPGKALAPQALAFAGLLLGNQWLHEAADREEDRQGEVRTTVLALGARRTAVLALLWAALSLLAVRWALPAPPTSAAPLRLCALAVALLVAPVALVGAGDVPSAMARARRAQRLTGALAALLLHLEAHGHG